MELPTMQRRSSDTQEALVEKIAARARSLDKGKELPSLVTFVKQYYRNVAMDDLATRDLDELAGAAVEELRFALVRKPGRPKIRAYNPRETSNGFSTTHTIIEIVNDDMPFLVDSVRMAINEAGQTVHLTIHPIMRVQRDGHGKLLEVLPRGGADAKGAMESIMHVEMDRETDAASLKALEERLAAVLDDVRAAVTDWEAMRVKAREICQELEQNPPPLEARGVEESIALIRWMEANHFTLLGYREYEFIRGKDFDTLRPLPKTGLGILRDPRPEFVPKAVELRQRDIRRQARSRDLLVITKANSKSTVHRSAYLDYVSVKVFDKAGRAVGEKRFLGLFTSVAYSRSPRDIPLLRYKVEEVLVRSGLDRGSHAGKALQHVLDTYPRDELFQTSIEDLLRISTGILSLQERQRVKLFVRRDAFHRFVSCMVFVPRDKYNTEVRQHIERTLMSFFKGIGNEHTVQLAESTLARLRFVVRLPKEGMPRVDLAKLEQEVAAGVRTWHDNLKDELIGRLGEEQALKLFKRFGDSFPAAYTEDVPPYEATFDLERMALLCDEPGELRMSLYRPAGFAREHLRFKVCRLKDPIPISDALPMLENMGLRVISERPYRCKVSKELSIWIQDFDMYHAGEGILEPAQIGDLFQQTFACTWAGQNDNDGFNRLVLGAELDWRQTYMMRAYCRYLLQTGLPFSQHYMEQVLAGNLHVSGQLVDLFTARFKPDLDEQTRKTNAARCEKEVRKALDKVDSQDEDRILRAFLTVILATLRTNYYQLDAHGQPKPYLSLKLDPSRIPELPLPRPKYEVFVYSPRTEGVHLRGGNVARGGLRWSDRMEDFRTEVLGLMKAQNVKNTLIVPVGAKGGFVAKKLPKGDRDTIQAEVIACYKSFIRGLLDITDNLVDGKVVPPPRVLRHDGDDYYLVVAADKGTATFSDIANSVSAEYGFWLGDAFASGGSAGYDHKGMGITAKGAWEAVKRHFREIGMDIQNQPFSVAGIGDMGGDVFGNGMLLSRHTRLLAAFNHVHIFLDPDPDTEASFAERERLFKLPRSAWSDYNAKLISRGGGIFSRSEKNIPLSPQVQQMLGTDKASMPPQELIRSILKMDVDLLWNGGIGTYVKASSETNADVGDRTNDQLRVNGRELRCKVIGEGGNLGCTQLGRIEFALNGGRLNTDFIDNSAGVDTSDREVNIKILTSLATQRKGLSRQERDKLLVRMTDDVAGLVLRNNYLQTQAISMMENHAVERINEHAVVLRALERHGGLNRELEFLPSDSAIEERRTAGKGFTRPELSLLVSYSKIVLYQSLINSSVPEDRFLARELESYFPKPLQKSFGELIPDHPLAREIIATLISNSVVNRMGPVFALRMQEETGAEPAKIARAYTICREAFGMREAWAEIEALDNVIHANVQYSMMFQTTRLLRHATQWVMQHYASPLNIEQIVSRLQPGITRVVKTLPNVLVGSLKSRYAETTGLYRDIGVPEAVAQRMAGLPAAYSALDIAEVGKQTGADVVRVAGIYFELGRALGLDWIMEQIEKLSVSGRWQAVARGTLRENLYSLQRSLTQQLLAAKTKDTPHELVTDWVSTVAARVAHLQRIINEMRSAGAMDFPTLSVALQEVRKLAQNG